MSETNNNPGVLFNSVDDAAEIVATGGQDALDDQIAAELAASKAAQAEVEAQKVATVDEVRTAVQLAIAPDPMSEGDVRMPNPLKDGGEAYSTQDDMPVDEDGNVNRNVTGIMD